MEYKNKYVIYYDLKNDISILTQKKLKLNAWGSFIDEYDRIYKSVYDNLEEAKKELKKMYNYRIEL